MRVNYSCIVWYKIVTYLNTELSQTLLDRIDEGLPLGFVNKVIGGVDRGEVGKIRIGNQIVFLSGYISEL
jgi:hypothetical protein